MNSTLNFLLKDYEQKKYACDLKFEKDKKNFYASHPELNEIKLKLAKLSFDMSKAVMSGNTDLANKLKSEVTSLTKEKDELLKNIKIPERSS